MTRDFVGEALQIAKDALLEGRGATQADVTARFRGLLDDLESYVPPTVDQGDAADRARWVIAQTCRCVLARKGAAA